MLYFLSIFRIPVSFSDDYSGYSTYFSYPDNTSGPPKSDAADTGGIPSYVWTILYVIGGIIAAAVLTGLIILAVRLIRRKWKQHQCQKQREQAAALRTQADTAIGPMQVNPAVAPAVAPAASAASVAPASFMPAAMVRHAAEEIPGETMAMLAERLRSYLESGGVTIGDGDAGRILANYAANGYVRVTALVAEASLIGETARLLSVFFGASMPSDAAPAEIFRPADDTVPEHMVTEIEMARSGAFGQAYCGIGTDTFRGILRETEDEQFLPEEDWRLVDRLLDGSTVVWLSTTRNQMVRRMESMSSCLIATGMSCEEALDRVLHSVLLPEVFRNGGPDALRETARIFEEQCRSRDLPLCRRYFLSHGAVPGIA